MDNYPQRPPNLKVYTNLKGDRCNGYLVGMLSTMTVYWNATTEKQEIGKGLDVL